MGAHPQKSVRVRFAPSPTGHFPVGNARSALFNWLFARKQGGVFILRIEDTDSSRSSKEYEGEIFAGLRWLGIEWDEGPDAGGEYGPYRQSERQDIYKKYLKALLDTGKAYYCYCTKEELDGERQTLLSQGLPPKYGGHCRNLQSFPSGKLPQVIRFKTPESQVEFKDMIRGKVTFDAGLFGDLAIAKDTETPLFNFAGVIDDELMQITHVIRGEDHLSNTPKQILLARALGFRDLSYAHLPLLLAADRSKISKRNGAISLLEYREKGYLPEAILNFLAFLGWHPTHDKEVLTIDELIQQFDLGRVQKAGAVFDEEKLLWLNREHLRALPDDELTERLLPFITRENKNVEVRKPLLKKIIAIERDRMKTLATAAADIRFFFELAEYPTSLLLQWQNAAAEDAGSILRAVLDSILKIPEVDFTLEALNASLAPLIAEKGKGAVLWPMRVALSGKEGSPGPFEIAFALGPTETARRLSVALSKLKSS